MSHLHEKLAQLDAELNEGRFDPTRHLRNRQGRFIDVLRRIEAEPGASKSMSADDRHVLNRLVTSKHVGVSDAGHHLTDKGRRSVATGRLHDTEDVLVRRKNRGSVGDPIAAGLGYDPGMDGGRIHQARLRLRDKLQGTFGTSRSSITPKSIAKADADDLRYALARFPNHEHAALMRRRLP